MNTYLYGVTRIGQQSLNGWQYYHGDALGSVRQLTDPIGEGTLAKSYQPYGSMLNGQGEGITSYDYTGEWRDATGLVHLRTRYNQPVIGHFISKDIWPGNPSQPGSL